MPNAVHSLSWQMRHDIVHRGLSQEKTRKDIGLSCAMRFLLSGKKLIQSRRKFPMKMDLLLPIIE